MMRSLSAQKERGLGAMRACERLGGEWVDDDACSKVALGTGTGREKGASGQSQRRGEGMVVRVRVRVFVVEQLAPFGSVYSSSLHTSSFVLNLKCLLHIPLCARLTHQAQ
jgi:hypothetical protein